MVEIIRNGAYLAFGSTVIEDDGSAKLQLAALGKENVSREEARKNTIAYSILSAHNKGGEDELKIKFDALASHDITYVGIIQTARASGLSEFPIPYVLTNCHNSLCAVGGTINEDDHVFGLSAAKKYGGIFVPPHIAVIHSYMREMMSGCGKMILGSDSHTRYGALGTMAIGEGGPELVKQLLSRTYDIRRPEVVAVVLTGSPKAGVGPQDVALELIGAVFKDGFVKNKVLEFVGDGVSNLPIEFRNGIDVMTTETTCLSSIWITDSETQRYYSLHGRSSDYRKLTPGAVAYYDGVIKIDLSRVEPMIALPFHPSNVYKIKDLCENPGDILRSVEESAKEQFGGKVNLPLTSKITDKGIRVDQGVIAGCAGGTFDNLMAAADILSGKSTGNGEFALSAYPASQPTYIELVRNGAAAKLMEAGVTLKTAFCGPCFGAGDVPANGGLSIRHSTRNFPNREGSKPGNGQLSAVALMDARSIAATAANGGILTPATGLEVEYTTPDYHFDGSIYAHRVYNGYGKAERDAKLIIGPGIADWNKMPELPGNLLLKVVSVITDPVTTTDELIPSGETSSYRSNPEKLSEFALSRKDPEYVGRAKEVRALEKSREAGESILPEILARISPLTWENTGLGSVVCAVKPGDGSAREQAASCQRVLGGSANIAVEYATKRYRSNLINWGMLPLLSDSFGEFELGDYVLIKGVKDAIASGAEKLTAVILKPDGEKETSFSLGKLTDDERDILLRGCLINYYKAQM